MKFLFILHCYPAVEGGAGLFSEIINGLEKENNCIEVLASNRVSTDDLINPNPKKVNKDIQKTNRVSIKYLDVFSRCRLFFRLGEKLFGLSFWTCLKKGPVFKNLPEIFKKRNTDWVITGLFPLANTFWGYLIAKRNRSKLAIIPAFHENDFEHRNPFLINLLKKANLIVCLTSHEKKVLLDMKVSCNKMIVGGGVVNNKLFSYKQNRAGKFPKIPNILYLGTKSAHKQIIVLIEAMKIIWDSDKKIRLTIAGPETLYSQKIKDKINSLDLKYKTRIRYLGKVSQSMKIDLIDSATMLVNPSSQESFGLVFAESWARKKPVIGANIPTIREVINKNKNGLLFTPGSATNLADKINDIISRPLLAKKMGENGYNKILKNYTSSHVIKKINRSFKDKCY